MCKSLAVALFGVLLGSCASRTEVILVVQADDALQSRVQTVEIRVVSPDGPSLAPIETPVFPLTLAIEDGGAGGTLSVQVLARDGADTVLDDQLASIDFAPGGRRMLYVELSSECSGCRTAEVCFRGECAAEQRRAGCDVVDALIDGERRAEDADEACLEVGEVTPPILDWRDLSVGRTHACAVDAEGRVFCWGSNDAEGLGDTAVPASSTPMQIDIAAVTQVGAGETFTCALTEDDDVRCWGRNGTGQLGMSPGSQGSTGTPVSIETPSGVADLGVGSSHACVLTTGGEVWCWGADEYEQTGESFEGTSPARVDLPPDALGLAVGADHTCAWFVDGRNCCWGRNSWAQLGDGSESHSEGEPQCNDHRGGLDAISGMALGDGHTCLLTDTGRVRCWGRNSWGETGAEEGDSEVSPIDVLETRSFVHLAAGDLHTCAIEADSHQRYCWGNDDRQFGAMQPGVPEPRRGIEDTEWARLELGQEYGCGFTTAGALHCWGYDLFGRVGRAPRVIHPRPSRVDLERGDYDVAAGGFQSCALDRADGQLMCWGWEGVSRSGPGSGEGGPTAVGGDVAFDRFELGQEHGCGLVDGRVYCFGTNDENQVLPDVEDVPVRAPTLVDFAGTGVRTVAPSDDHTCATTGSEIRCWGENGDLALGAPDPDDLTSLIDGLAPVRFFDGLRGEVHGALAVGRGHTCTLTEFDEVRCWGENDENQASPDGNPEQGPYTITQERDYRFVGAGEAFSCAASEKSVFCWGEHDNGQLGDDEVNEPDVVEIPLPTSSTSLQGLTLGEHHACVWSSDEVICWGSASHGQLGHGVVGSSGAPARVELGDDSAGRVLSVRAGELHTCAVLTADGGGTELYCWGSDGFGQVGAGRPMVWPSPGPTNRP